MENVVPLKDKVVAIMGTTIIDGTGSAPILNGTILFEGERISAVSSGDVPVPQDCEIIDAKGAFVIPGLMDANVHLMGEIRLEGYVRYEGRYEEIIVEAAQIALKGGLTTVFDTWGPRRPLMAIRDAINSGTVDGSRVFCAGNIIGLDGPFSLDFLPKALGVVGAELMERTNALYVENVGPDLTWMSPEQVAKEVGDYIATGIDFIKYASSEHRWMEHEATASLLFSFEAQKAMIDAAHSVGMTAQAHATAVEALRVAVEAGCDIIQHANVTGPVPIPQSTIDLMGRRRTGTVIFPFTEKRFQLLMNSPNPSQRRYFSTSDLNCRNLAASGAKLLLATDGILPPQDIIHDAKRQIGWMQEGEDNLGRLGDGHFVWLKAMEEKGLPAHEGLLAATRNIAEAYGVSDHLGTLEPGKYADMLILEKNPLESAKNYRSIRHIIKSGRIIDRHSLPTQAVLTAPLPPRNEAQSRYGRYAISKFPCCFGH